MSERKVLNVSTKIKNAHVISFAVCTVYFHYLKNYVLTIVEILSAGFRSVEDPAHETGEKSPVYRATDGAV